MDTKVWWKSRTLWSIILTSGVEVGKQFAPPQYLHSLEILQTILVSSGLWFARLGAGTQIVAKETK
jgi:hypothetical protein